MKKAVENKYDVQLPPYQAMEVMAKNTQLVDWGHSRMKASTVYHETQGEGCCVFILDTGLPDHIDLNENILHELSRNWSDSETMADLHGHSTHCAGIVAAANNDIGTIGVSPRAKLAFHKVLNDRGAGISNWQVSAITEISDMDLPYQKIISLSLGSNHPKAQVKAAIEYARSKGVEVVAAAGNDGYNDEDSIDYPGAFPGVWTIGSINRHGSRSMFSSQGDTLDFVLPGSQIYSCGLDGTYVVMSGTSMAGPQFAGILALLKSRFPELNDLAKMDKFLRGQAIDLGATGHDKQFGHGELRLDWLFEAAKKRETLPEPEPEPAPETKEEKAIVLAHYRAMFKKIDLYKMYEPTLVSIARYFDLKKADGTTITEKDKRKDTISTIWKYLSDGK